MDESGADSAHTFALHGVSRRLLVVDGESHGVNAFAAFLQGASDRRRQIGGGDELQERTVVEVVEGLIGAQRFGVDAAWFETQYVVVSTYRRFQVFDPDYYVVLYFIQCHFCGNFP